MAKQTRITVESDSLLILRGQSSMRAWCSRCAAEVDTILMEDTGVISDLDQPALEECLNSERLHQLQAADGSELTCMSSLLARSRAENQNQLTAESAVAKQAKGDDMKSTLLLTTSLLLLPAALTAQDRSDRRDHKQPHYRLSDLGPAGNPFSQGTYINSWGLIPGVDTTTDGTAHAVIFDDDLVKDIGTPGLGGPNSGAFGANDRGQVVGQGETPAKDRQEHPPWHPPLHQPALQRPKKVCLRPTPKFTGLLPRPLPLCYA